MPDEYISRKAAAKLLGYTFGVDVVRKLHEVPAADVAPVVHGQWDGEGDGYADGEIVLDVWHCSQ